MSKALVRGTEPGPLLDSTVLVTGGAGFIGSHLVDALTSVADVRVLDDCSSGRATAVHDDATLAVGDITDRETLAAAVDGVDHVFHLAAVSTVPDAMADPTRTLDVNVRATGELLELAAEANARVVFASSAAVYGDPASTPIAETHPKAPREPYGVSKLAGDQFVQGYDDWFDVDAVALRLFNVYGPGQVNGVVPAFLDRVRRGDSLVVHGDGTQTRDFVHVDDVVRAMVVAARTDATGEAYNVGTGDATSIRALADIVHDAAHRDVEVVHDDPRPADIPESQADTAKTRRKLGFEARTTLDDGIESLVERALGVA